MERIVRNKQVATWLNTEIGTQNTEKRSNNWIVYNLLILCTSGSSEYMKNFRGCCYYKGPYCTREGLSGKFT